VYKEIDKMILAVRWHLKRIFWVQTTPQL